MILMPSQPVTNPEMAMLRDVFDFIEGNAFEDATAELRQIDRDRRQHHNQYMAHPDPRDPEYPGELQEEEV